ncbi:hypothetical protein EJB05_12461 [Eragrostis curvula]|uniref:Uncharacterized protein n=1 Tax=Eragrostis curvula TaxID=38414 RepID=A0A5J9VT76_9POAL|nr:hypothetical protein EJB05_12461 [Eragrostis curvula]
MTESTLLDAKLVRTEDIRNTASIPRLTSMDGSSVGFLETLENALSLLQEKDFHAIGLLLVVEGCTLPSNVIRMTGVWLNVGVSHNKWLK